VRYRQQLVAQIDWLAQMLADGRPFLQGAEPGAADIAAYHILWFLHFGGDNCTDVLVGIARVNEWMMRVRDIGHGSRSEMSSTEALDVARATSPATTPYVEAGNAEGFELGEQMQVRPHLAGRNPTVGSLVVLTRHRVAIAHRNERVGDMVVHFPRIGYVVSRA
jgi:glutathione S-transferase